VKCTGLGSDDTSLPRYFGSEVQRYRPLRPAALGQRKGRWNIERTCTTAPEGAWVPYYDKVMYVTFRAIKLEFYVHVVQRLHEGADVVGYIGGRLDDSTQIQDVQNAPKETKPSAWSLRSE
jgi:hypothetical protein